MALINFRNNQLLYLILDDEEDVERENDNDDDDVLRIDIDLEQWKRLSDASFEEHFRMNREIFELLLAAVGNHMLNRGQILRRSRKGLDVALMMVLWILASPDTFRAVGVKFGVKKGVVHFHYKYIIRALRELVPSYIKWPNDYEKEVIAGVFEDTYGYPSVIGCMDGCLIRITAPLEQPQEYVDWHRHHSINLQAVCDHRMIFRDVYIGEPGSVGDKRTFSRSPLGRNSLHRPEIMSDKHLLADGGYTLTRMVMIPYQDYGNLTRRMRNHNYNLSRCRAIIERAFALLKGKWRRLKFFPTYCVEYAVDHIAACVMLHNFIILEGNGYEVAELDEEDAQPQPMNERRLIEQAKADGVAKRDFIAALLDPNV